MAAVSRVAHDRDRPDDLEAWGVGGDDDLTGPGVRRSVRVAHHHGDGEGRAQGAGGEPLVAVYHPLVTFAPGPGLQARGIRACDLGLRHREAGAHVAVEERLQELLLLVVGTELEQDLGVAGVRRLAVEDSGRHGAASHDLAKGCVVEVAEPGSPLGVGQEEVPESDLPGASP